jgi:hypothetical protein
MIKVCLIGDSHLGVLQTATVDTAIRQSHELVFFACHVQFVSALVLAGRKLISTDAELTEKLQQFSGGLDHIDVDAYDEFVIIGHGFDIKQLVGRYSRFVADSMPGGANGNYLLSDACYLSMGEQACQALQAFRLTAAIRSVCDKPVTVISGPNPSQGLDEALVPEWCLPYFTAVRNGDDMVLGGLFREVCARLARKNKVKVIPPPPEAAANGVLNKFEYSQLDGAANNGKLMNAMVHGNTKYGTLLLPYIFGQALPG